jgi:hypothetical protein
MTVAYVRIWTVGLENVPGIVGLSDALFREADGCRDPATNLEWALQEGRGRVVRRAPSRRCGRLLAGGASSRWGCHRVPGGPPVRSGLPSDGEGGDAGEHVCPRGSGDTAREPSDIGGRLGEISAPTLSSAGAEIASTRPIFSGRWQKASRTHASSSTKTTHTGAPSPTGASAGTSSPFYSHARPSTTRSGFPLSRE